MRGFSTASSYDPEKAPEADEWLSLDEGYRLRVIQAYHRRKRLRLPDRRVHAAIHLVVENQLGLGEAVVATTLARLRQEGLTRHDAIHAIGTVLVGHVHDILIGKRLDPDTDVNELYLEELKSLTAESWRNSV